MAKNKDKVLACEPDDKWKIESDFRTLKEAKMIEQDPERYEKAMKFGKKEIKAMKAITSTKELRELSNKMAMNDEDDDE